MINTIHVPFRLMVVAVFIAILCPSLFQDGMFMDGLFYACVGKNLSQGMGTWWHPHLSETFLSDYHEQPPMLFWLQSIFFLVFGTGFWVERFYSLLAASANAFIISLLWKRLFPQEDARRSFNWLPVLFWIVIPVCSFTFINNLEEGTMSIFALSAIYLVVSAMKGKNNKYLLLVLAGLCVLCAAFTKGVQGVFPIVTVFFYWIVFRNISFKKMIIYSLVVVGVPLLLFGVLILNQNIYESFISYFYERIYRTFHNESSNTTGFHFSLFLRLLIELIPVYLILIITYLIGRLKPVEWRLKREEKLYAIFFLLIGLSASLPLVVTLEQRSFYLTTSLPYFSLALSMLALPQLKQIFLNLKVQSKALRMLVYVSGLVIAFGIIFTLMNFGKPKRDEVVLKDFKLIANETGQGVVIATNYELFSHWSWQGYLIRYYNISLDQSEGAARVYFLVNKSTPFASNENYVKVDLPLSEFELYKRDN